MCILLKGGHHVQIYHNKFTQLYYKVKSRIWESSLLIQRFKSRMCPIRSIGIEQTDTFYYYKSRAWCERVVTNIGIF